MDRRSRGHGFAAVLAVVFAAVAPSSTGCGGSGSVAEAGTETGSSGGTSVSSSADPSGPVGTSPAPTSETGVDPGSSSNADSDPASESDASGAADSTGQSDPPEPGTFLCSMAPPGGAEPPPPIPAYSGEVCPPLVPGWNTMASSGAPRDVLVVAPSDLQPDEQLPVAVLWHWLGGSAEAFVEEADVQTAVDQFRFLALIPAEKGDLLFRWPFSTVDTEPRMQEEFVFFDDMLACAAESYRVNNSCVTSVGVSAGALFTSQLGAFRSAYLSSMVVLSGGTGGLVKPWAGAEHILPALVLWGGPSDICIALDFVDTSSDLENELQADGHAVIECEHNCGHAAPPFESGDPDLTSFAGMWQFFLDHPHWLDDGETPWAAEGTPSTLPEWCAVGVGSSTPRSGECPPGGGC